MGGLILWGICAVASGARMRAYVKVRLRFCAPVLPSSAALKSIRFMEWGVCTVASGAQMRVYAKVRLPVFGSKNKKSLLRKGGFCK